MNFLLKDKLFQIPIQLILLVYTQIMGFNHDQGIPKSFLGFLLALSESTFFDFPKFIADSMHEQFRVFSSLRAF